MDFYFYIVIYYYTNRYVFQNQSFKPQFDYFSNHVSQVLWILIKRGENYFVISYSMILLFNIFSPGLLQLLTTLFDLVSRSSYPLKFVDVFASI